MEQANNSKALINLVLDICEWYQAPPQKTYCRLREEPICRTRYTCRSESESGSEWLEQCI